MNVQAFCIILLPIIIVFVFYTFKLAFWDAPRIKKQKEAELAEAGYREPIKLKARVRSKNQKVQRTRGDS